MKEKIAEIIEAKHNVVVDAETNQYNINDSDYGWKPVPQEWIDEAEAESHNWN